MRKVNNLLVQLADTGRKATYLALDISERSLASNLDLLAPAHAGGSVRMAGLWGDFEAGLGFVDALPPAAPRVLLSLGSVLFNDPWDRAVATLRRWASLMRTDDLILAGMDGHDVASPKVWDAYHARPDLFETFFHNGLAHANALLGHDVFRPEDWDICAEIEEEEGRHRFYLRARRDVVGGGTGDDDDETEVVVLKEGTELDWFDAHKRPQCMVRKMCAEAGLEIIRSWAVEGSEMRQYLIRRDTSAAEASCDESDSAISISGV